MNAIIARDLYQQMQDFAEMGYSEEVAGLILGKAKFDNAVCHHFFPVTNDREAEARHHRYQITPEDWIKGEIEADKLGLDIIAVFHTHPDHPSIPSSFDLNHALPTLIYLIASVYQGQMRSIQAWILRDDRTSFDECSVQLTQEP